MKTERIKQLIQEKKWSLLVSEFSDFDKNSTSINQLQKSCGLPLEPHGCHLAQRLRGHIMSFITNYTGHSHLDGAKYSAIAIHHDSKRILKAVEVIENVRGDLKDVYGRISAFLYPD